MTSEGKLRLVVTRPAAQSAAAVRQLAARGIDAVALPLIEIAGAADIAPLRAAWTQLADYRLVVFVSVNAVQHFFAVRPEGVDWPAETLAATPGPGTAAALAGVGVDPSCIVEPAADSPQLDSEALWQRLRALDWQGRRVLFVRGDGGREWLAEQLVAAGAVAEALTAYVRRAPELDASARRLIDAVAQEPDRHAWLFSSSQAIDHLAATDIDGPWRHAAAIVTHARIAERARRAGFANVHEVRAGLDDVVACIQSMRP